jgi:hypothetical protein
LAETITTGQLHFHCAPGDHVLEGGAVEELHGQKGSAVLFSDVVDGADIRMIERRCCLRFALKACQGLGVGGQIIGQELQRHKTMQPHIFSFVNHSHSPSAELLDDAVMRNGLANHGLAEHGVVPC